MDTATYAKTILTQMMQDSDYDACDIRQAYADSVDSATYSATALIGTSQASSRVALDSNKNCYLKIPSFLGSQTVAWTKVGSANSSRCKTFVKRAKFIAGVGTLPLLQNGAIVIPAPGTSAYNTFMTQQGATLVQEGTGNKTNLSLSELTALQGTSTAAPPQN